MNQTETGNLIRQFRIANGLTQKQLADRICVSDKAVSKWECGKGCPDISLLAALADVFGTNVEVLLTGRIDKNEKEKGDMKKIRFYFCPSCGNIVTSAADANVTCCGKTLPALLPRKASESEMLKVESTDGEWYITSGHPMSKTHFIRFVAFVSDSAVMLFRQYPEWDINLTVPMYRAGRLMWFCSECGLFYQDLRPY